MTDEKPPLESRSLSVLLEARGWKANRLAHELGIQPDTLYKYLNGRPKPPRKVQEQAAAVMGYPPVVLPRSLDFVRHLDEVEGNALAEGEDAADREIDQLVTEMAFELVTPLRGSMRRCRRRIVAYGERMLAPVLWERLKTYSQAQRKGVVRQAHAFHSGGLVELVCDKSIRAAADDADRSVELADLACVVAGTLPAARRDRAQGYAWFHLGNSRRVQGNLRSADEAVRQATGFWKAGADDDSGLFDEARVLDLEASLRREQRDFPAALDLLDRAVAADRSGIRAGRILVKRAKTLEEMGDTEEAIATLRRALSLSERGDDPRLPLTVNFNLLVLFCDAGRHLEAEQSLEGVQELAERLGNELDLVRYVWLRSRVGAGLGHREEAEAGYQQVRRDFLDRRIAFDAALVSLELAVFYLDEGRTAEVQQVAIELLPVFEAQKVTREALATVKLFCDAARQETLTAEMARQLLKDLRKAGSPSPAPGPGPQG